MEKKNKFEKDKELLEFRKALGKTGQELSDEKLQTLYACFSDLIDSLLDQKEVKIFGKTIDEIIA